MGPNSHGWPAQVENFSKVKDFQQQFQSWPFQGGLPLDGSHQKFLVKFAKLIVRCLKV